MRAADSYSRGQSHVSVNRGVIRVVESALNDDEATTRRRQSNRVLSWMVGSLSSCSNSNHPQKGKNPRNRETGNKNLFDRLRIA